MKDVYGHEQAKKALKVMIKRSQDRYYNKEVMGRPDCSAPLKILLIGPSGTGKTHLVSSLRRQYDFPCLMLDATHFTPTGATGGISSLKLRDIIRQTANEYLKKTGYHSIEGVLSQMVIFVDEFDKLGNSFDSSGNWNSHVQSSFLTLIEDKEEFAGVSWVFAGAFSELFKKTEVKKQIGFFAVEQTEKKKQITDADILRAGIIPEILGRISVIAQLDTFTVEDYINVTKEYLLPLHSDVTVSEAELVNMAQTALESGLGIRSLTRQLEMLSINSVLGI